MVDAVNIGDPKTFGLKISGEINSKKSTPTSSVSQGPTDVNFFEGSDVNFKWVEKNQPEPPEDVEQYQNGTQTTPAVGRGRIEKSIIYKMNIQTDHACHLYAGFNATSLGADLGLKSLFELPPSRIQASIQLRLNFSGIMQKLREAINGVLEALGLDFTGEISYWYSEAKRLVRWIKKQTKFIMQLISDINALVKFINELVGVINYLISLPAQLLSMAQQCIFGFLDSMIALPAQIAAIPGAVVGSTIQESLNSLSGLATDAQGTINDKSASATTSKNGISLDSSADDIKQQFAITPESPTLQSPAKGKP